MICSRCVLDSSIADIQFDKNGCCNYCTDYLSKKVSVLKDKEQLNAILKKIKRSPKKNTCIVGVSGGLDSSYLLYKAVQLNLNPVAVHIDTGWNTETSAYNIETITRKLNVDLRTYVLDWEQFSKVQISYLKAGVIDIEFPTDHYYLAALYKMASKLNAKYILTGNNYSSEGIMPACWIHNKGDTFNMLDIYKKFGDGTSLNSLPTMTLWKKFYYYNIKRIENIFLLDYFDYNREHAKELLVKECGWKEYPTKHGESIFTRFYQRYIMPTRFNADIRRPHLSALICNSQISRNDALTILESDVSKELIYQDKPFVLKKLGVTEEQFNNFMSMPLKNHQDFRSEIKIKKMYNALCRLYGFNRFLKISNRT